MLSDLPKISAQSAQSAQINLNQHLIAGGAGALVGASKPIGRIGRRSARCKPTNFPNLGGLGALGGLIRQEIQMPRRRQPEAALQRRQRAHLWRALAQKHEVASLKRCVKRKGCGKR
jgi:uncharacterized membrane protein YebE (DUF533 family)